MHEQPPAGEVGVDLGPVEAEELGALLRTGIGDVAFDDPGREQVEDGRELALLKFGNELVVELARDGVDLKQVQLPNAEPQVRPAGPDQRRVRGEAALGLADLLRPEAGLLLPLADERQEVPRDPLAELEDAGLGMGPGT
jgi:hypothetical protein